MAEYIERDAVLALSDDFELTLEDDEIFFEYIPVKGVKELPAADVAPVRHGYWQITQCYPHNVYCSECHTRFAQTHWAVWEDGSLPRNYCPNCGAKMDGEQHG